MRRLLGALVVALLVIAGWWWAAGVGRTGTADSCRDAGELLLETKDSAVLASGFQSIADGGDRESEEVFGDLAKEFRLLDQRGTYDSAGNVMATTSLIDALTAMETASGIG